MPGSKRKESKLKKLSSWHALGPSRQANYKLELMLAEMEKETGSYQKALQAYLKVLKIFFQSEVYKSAVECIDKLPKNKQHKYLYELGKILLIHCQQPTLAHETLDKLSILDPAFLKPVQSILLKYNGTKAPVFKHIRSILGQSRRSTEQARKNNHSKTAADSKEKSKQIDTEMQLSLEESGEHFLVQEESEVIDQETLDNLMDSLLNEE